ncbi:hypothetical protein [Nocardia stercoris]|uniref:Uncharacterized protein n=1 Tax=Nocardia stercoris TaxID=2483361 RepID=A0A3M2LDY6_9NOCA|nr:hypothetical protein [Nocardia stercoris]RMI32908.1 hypothetical protein EBN03_13400 [Nocardia stercoris]
MTQGAGVPSVSVAPAAAGRWRRAAGSRRNRVLEAFACFFIAAAAGTAVFVPTDFRWAGPDVYAGYGARMNSVTEAPSIGVVVAVLTAASLSAMAGRRAAWTTVAVATTGLLLDHVVADYLVRPESGTYVTYNAVEAVLGGVALGALGVAVLDRGIVAVGYGLGAVGFWIFGDLNQIVDLMAGTTDHDADMPSLLLVGPAAILSILCLLRHRRDPRPLLIEYPQSPRGSTLISAAILSAAMLILSSWVDEHAHVPNDRHLNTIVVTAVVLTVGAALLSALLLPGRDGVAILLVVALISVCDSVGYRSLSEWGVLLLFAATAFGLWAAIRYPSPRFAILALLVFAAILPIMAGADLPRNGLLHLPIAFLVGYYLFTLRPVDNAAAVLALGTLYLPSITHPLHPQSRTAQFTEPFRAYPALVALAITVGCVTGVVALLALRPARSDRMPGTAVG